VPAELATVFADHGSASTPDVKVIGPPLRYGGPDRSSFLPCSLFLPLFLAFLNTLASVMDFVQNHPTKVASSNFLCFPLRLCYAERGVTPTVDGWFHR